MVMVRRFQALRPRAELAREVASPPYDVVSTAEARALAEGRPESFLRVSCPEIELAPDVDPHSPEVYARAGENLRAMIDRGALVEDDVPRLYAYAQTRGSHRQVGVVGCVSVAEYRDDVIRKHEKTRAEKEDDRTRHIDAAGAHDEPVFLAYRGVAAIDDAVARAMKSPPAYDFVADDGVGHALWVIEPEASAAIESLFASEVPLLYVADGHHRSAAAQRVAELRAGTPGEHDVFLAVVFPAEQLKILGYHRLVRDAQGRSPEALRAALEGVMTLSPTEVPEPTEPGTVGLYLGGRWWRGVFKNPVDARDPVKALDVSRVQDELLAPIFGVTDPRRDARVDFVGGIRGAGELARRVDAEGWSLAIAMHPTRVEELLAVSDAGMLMPPKSTWFEPKLRSGLFVHRF